MSISHGRAFSEDELQQPNANPNPPESPQDVVSEPPTIPSPSRQEVRRLHALCVAELGRCWSEADLVEGAEAYRDGQVQFSGSQSKPSTTEDGARVLAAAVAGMRGAL